MPGLVYGFLAILIAGAARAEVSGATQYALAGTLSAGWIAVCWWDKSAGWLNAMLQMLTALLSFGYVFGYLPFLTGAADFSGPDFDPLFTWIAIVFFAYLPIAAAVGCPIRNAMEYSGMDTMPALRLAGSFFACVIGIVSIPLAISAFAGQQNAWETFTSGTIGAGLNLLGLMAFLGMLLATLAVIWQAWFRSAE